MDKLKELQAAWQAGWEDMSRDFCPWWAKELITDLRKKGWFRAPQGQIDYRDQKERFMSTMLVDLGFPEGGPRPTWAIVLANRLVEAGWSKEVGHGQVSP